MDHSRLNGFLVRLVSIERMVAENRCEMDLGLIVGAKSMVVECEVVKCL